MNLGEIRMATYDRVDLSSSDPQMSSDKVTRFINTAKNMITMERDWPWLQQETTFTTVAGQQKYPVLPANWVGTRELVLEFGAGNTLVQPLEEKSRLTLDDRFDLVPQSRPWYWALFGETIVLAPVPDAVYTVVHRYDISEPDMTSDSDVMIMPAEFHHTVADLAAFLCLRRDREDPRAKVAWDTYQAGMKLMTRRHRRVMAPLQIRVRPGGGI